MPRTNLVLKPLLFCMAFFALAGCTATPLYQPTQGSTASNAVYAKSIRFAAPKNRVGQIVRDTAIFRLYGGSGEPADASLEGSFIVKASSSNAFRTSTTSVGQTSAAVITVSGTLTITDTATGETVQEFKRSTIAAIDKNSQQFANERALLDAENRAGEQLGEQFATLLASRVLR